MKDIQIKKVTIEEIDELQKIASQTFYETFASDNTGENMKLYLQERFSIEKLMTEFNSSDSEFYFASFQNKIVGYLKLNFGHSQTELKYSNAVEIERIYVLKEFHGRKVGQILLQNAIELAKQKNAEFVWLGVWEKNFRAISFYKKNGFEEFDKHIFSLGNDEQTDIMMKLKLKDE